MASPTEGPCSANPAAGNNPSVPADLLGARQFNIADHKIADFRQQNQRESAQAITFALGKPSGSTQGVAALINPSVQFTLNMVVRRSGGSTKFAPPTSEFAEPELAQFIESVHVVPMVDVTGLKATGHLCPFRITSWSGYEAIFSALVNLRAGEGLFWRYLRGKGGSDVGGYEVEPFKLDARQQTIMASVVWPTAEDLAQIIPPVPFDELQRENFNLQRAWQKVLQRRGTH